MLQSQHSISLESSVFNEVDRGCLTCYMDKLQIFNKIKLLKRYAGVLVGILNELQWCFFKGKKLNKLYYLWSCPPPLLCYTQTPVAMLLHRFVETETEVVHSGLKMICSSYSEMTSYYHFCTLSVQPLSLSESWEHTMLLSNFCSAAFLSSFFPCVVENVIHSHIILRQTYNASYRCYLDTPGYGSAVNKGHSKCAISNVNHKRNCILAKYNTIVLYHTINEHKADLKHLPLCLAVYVKRIKIHEKIMRK